MDSKDFKDIYNTLFSVLHKESGFKNWILLHYYFSVRLIFLQMIIDKARDTESPVELKQRPNK